MFVDRTAPTAVLRRRSMFLDPHRPDPPTSEGGTCLWTAHRRDRPPPKEVHVYRPHIAATADLRRRYVFIDRIAATADLRRRSMFYRNPDPRNRQGLSTFRKLKRNRGS